MEPRLKRRAGPELKAELGNDPSDPNESLILQGEDPLVCELHLIVRGHPRNCRTRRKRRS